MNRRGLSMLLLNITFILLTGTLTAECQVIGETLPKKISRSEKYVFYLHGGVVTVLGNNAINQSMPEWGPYEYLNILDSLRSRGFNVISENRKQGIDDTTYSNKIRHQIDTLLSKGVIEKNILILGASAGWNVVLQVSEKMQNNKLKYVIMGGCWPETYKDYEATKLYGHFLSIIEASDPHGTCFKIFVQEDSRGEKRKGISSYEEITLHTGLSHGFIYKGHKEWIDPVVKWSAKK
ncbi:MAG: hypothetical protein WD824_21575 [Cyclobacteriaceae bacterium]